MTESVGSSDHDRHVLRKDRFRVTGMAVARLDRVLNRFMSDNPQPNSRAAGSARQRLTGTGLIRINGFHGILAISLLVAPSVAHAQEPTTTPPQQQECSDDAAKP